MVIRGEERYGPYSRDELRTMAAEGNIVADDIVWKEGLKSPVHLASVLDLQLEAHPVLAIAGQSQQRAATFFWRMFWYGVLSFLVVAALLFALLLYPTAFDAVDIPSRPWMLWILAVMIFVFIPVGLLGASISELWQQLASGISQGWTGSNTRSANPQGYWRGIRAQLLLPGIMLLGLVLALLILLR